MPKRVQAWHNWSETSSWIAHLVDLSLVTLNANTITKSDELISPDKHPCLLAILNVVRQNGVSSSRRGVHILVDVLNNKWAHTTLRGSDRGKGRGNRIRVIASMPARYKLTTKLHQDIIEMGRDRLKL